MNARPRGSLAEIGFLRFATIGAAVATIVGSCSLFFAPEPDADPVSVFDVLWNEFATHYALFDQRSIDWGAVRAANRGRLDPSSNDDELFAVLSDSLRVLDDGHVKLMAPSRPVFESNSIKRELPDFSLFDLSVIRENYLEHTEIGDGDSYVAGLISGRVAYVHLPYIGPNSAAVPATLERFPDADGLIVDLRHNAGGDFTWAFAHLGVLTDSPRLVFSSRTKNGPGTDHFTEWVDWYLEPTGVDNPIPVVALVDRYTISAGERAAMAIKALRNSLLVGEPTNGAQSTMVGRELPNGWYFSLSVQQVEYADGVSYEGVGLPVDVAVANTAGRLALGIDDVLAAGLSEL